MHQDPSGNPEGDEVMDAATEKMSGELRDELAANNTRRMVDPRTQPARFHNLKAMGQSALHCLQSFQYEDDRNSLAIRIGSGTHALLFDQPIVQFSGKVRRGKDWDTFKAANSNKTILNAKEHAKATAIANAIKSHPTAARLIYSPDVVFEQSIEWDQGGRKRRSTPDARGTYHLVELKTTRCAEPGRFSRDAMFRAYHAQIADYACAIEAKVGIKPRDCFLIAVESVPPYAVTVMRLTERALEMGERLCRAWMERLRACEDSQAWPAYCETITDFDVPEDDLDLVFADEDADEEDAA
jgi:PDDEXK-like domain of unknown function (DUF3799)